MIAAAVALSVLWTLPVSAASQEEMYSRQLTASGADTLIERLPADTRELLEEMHLDEITPSAYTDLRFEDVLRALGDLLGKSAVSPLRVLAALLGVVLVSAMFGGLEGVSNATPLRGTYHTVAVLASCGLLLTPFTGLLSSVSRTAESVRVFMVSYVPVYGAVLAAGGSVSAALSYQTTLLTAAEILTQLIVAVILPVLVLSLGLGCTGAVTEGFGLDAVSTALHKAILWTLGLFSTVFSGVLSVQQMVATAGDTLGSRAMRFSIASFVPVVGGAISEAYSTVAGCAGLLRSAVGCFGTAATLLLVLPPLVNCLCWNIALLIGGTAASLFHLSALEKLCRTVAGAVRALIAVLAVFALLMIVSTSVIAFTGKA